MKLTLFMRHLYYLRIYFVSFVLWSTLEKSQSVIFVNCISFFESSLHPNYERKSLTDTTDAEWKLANIICCHFEPSFCHFVIFQYKSFALTSFHPKMILLLDGKGEGGWDSKIFLQENIYVYNYDCAKQ